MPSETQIAEFLDADPPAAADAAVDVGTQRGGIELAFTDEDGQALQAYAVAVDVTLKKRGRRLRVKFLRARDAALRNQVCLRPCA